MESWLVYLFSGRMQSNNCDIIAIIGTSATNYRISSNEIYYICVKGHP